MKPNQIPPAKELDESQAPHCEGSRHRILLVEDHPIVSRGVSELINYETDLQVCGTAEDYASALEKVDSLKPDLILLDITLKGRGGLELLKDIRARRPKQRILMLSMHDESLYAARALRCGASGYLMKEEATDTLLAALRQVLEGETYLSPRLGKHVMRRMLQGTSSSTLDPVESLSDRELEVFRMIGHGKTTREIAKILFLSVKTIETHREHIKQKLSLETGSELVQRAIHFERESGPRADA